MPLTNPAPTFEKQAELVQTFYAKLADIVDRRGWSESDARRIHLNHMMMAARASVATLRLLQWAKQGGVPAVVQALRLEKAEDINAVVEDLLRGSRRFLLAETNFQLEALFRNLLLAAGRPSEAPGFHRAARDVLAAAGIPDQPVKLSMLNVGALMRDALLAGGIHHGIDTFEILNGVEFRFEHGKHVHCESWYRIVVALTAAAEVVDEVLSGGPFAALTQVPDRCSERRALATT